MAANLGYINLKTAVFQPIIPRIGSSPLLMPVGRGLDLLLIFEPEQLFLKPNELPQVILEMSGPVDHYAKAIPVRFPRKIFIRNGGMLLQPFFRCPAL